MQRPLEWLTPPTFRGTAPVLLLRMADELRIHGGMLLPFVKNQHTPRERGGL